MIRFLPITGISALQLTLLLTAISVLVSSIEGLYHHKVYAPNGWLGWDRLRPCRNIYTSSPFIGKLSDWFFTYPAILVLIFGRIPLAIFLIMNILNGRLPGLPILLLAISGILVHIRSQFANNGSDQLANIILISASIACLPAKDNLILYLSIFFIACQSTLSYLTSGFLKLITRDWRNGNNLRDIFSTATFGHPWINRIIGNRQFVFKVISLTVIFLELLLGFAIILSPPVCAVLLLLGIILHAGIAFTMGLNNFLWTFPATYPCLYIICVRLHL